MFPLSGVEVSALLPNISLGFLLQAREVDREVFHLLDGTSPYFNMLLRWIHLIAGIVWIGHLYFFNLVNVNLMAKLDAPTKGKVIPQLMPRALWWFRWGAVATVLAGLTYYAMVWIAPQARNAGTNPWLVLLVWIVIIVVLFAVEMVLLQKINNGWALAVAVALLSIVLAIATIYWLATMLGSAASNHTYSIGIGGGLGILMMLNVWGIIWPNQKRIISWTADNAENGTAIPPESAKLARIAFLASRTNTWLSIPMLFFMGASEHFTMFGLT
jgi:uncharacterized membrane protein